MDNEILLGKVIIITFNGIPLEGLVDGTIIKNTQRIKCDGETKRKNKEEKICQ